MTTPVKTCASCEAGLPTRGSRICPACGHEFRGNGWDGIDAHWRARHASIESYEVFFASLCSEHRLSRPPLVATTEAGLRREAVAVTMLLAGKTVREIVRNGADELGIEFADGSRVFINSTEEGLQVSVE